MKKLLQAATASVSAFAFAPAADALQFITTPGSAASFAAPAGGTTVNFDGALPTGVMLYGRSFSIVRGDLAGQYAEPAFSDGSAYLAVTANNFMLGADVTVAGPGFRSVSFFLGSIDPLNAVQILRARPKIELSDFSGL